MKILEIIPFTADEGLINYERKFLPRDVDVVALKEGVLCECLSDLARNLPSILDAIKDAQRKGYDITVINPLVIAIEMARALVKLKLVHNRRPYPKPPLPMKQYAAKP